MEIHVVFMVSVVDQTCRPIEVSSITVADQSQSPVAPPGD